MTVLQNTDAISANGLDWTSIEWSKIGNEVMKLQVRIAKATREGHWRKVKTLQWLLTHSFSAKCLAVKKITQNKGKRTPGVDGVILKTSQDKAQLVTSLKRRNYYPKPLRRIYIPKSNGKKRPLGIPTMQDRAMQSLHALALLPVSETTADWNSYGFRPERCTADAIEGLFNGLCRKMSSTWVMEGDIKGCFDNISHEWLLKSICTDREILRRWLQSGYMDKGELFPSEKGTPQGGTISPLLSNMTLDGMEDMLGRKFGSYKLDGSTYKTNKHPIHLVRYADDFVIIGRSKEILENEVRPMITAFLKERGLELSAEKTKITHVSEGFDFLGQTVKRYRFGKSNSKLLTRPSKKNVETFLDGIRTAIKQMATAKQQDVIEMLNPKIRGWTTYHRSAAAKQTFGRVENVIWRSLWNWAKRRHPTKNKRWIFNRYFHQVGTRKGCFSCKLDNGEMLMLYDAKKTVIQRHIKIRKAATPFDPAFESYFEYRTSRKMEGTLVGRTKIASVLKKQKGCCPECGERITSVTSGRVYFVISRLNGGTTNTSNLILLHLKCYNSLERKRSRVCATGQGQQDLDFKLA